MAGQRKVSRVLRTQLYGTESQSPYPCEFDSARGVQFGLFSIYSVIYFRYLRVRVRVGAVSTVDQFMGLLFVGHQLLALSVFEDDRKNFLRTRRCTPR